MRPSWGGRTPLRPAQAVALLTEILREAEAEAVLGPADPDIERLRETLDWARWGAANATAARA